MSLDAPIELVNQAGETIFKYKPGGGIVPASFVAALEEEVQREVERVGRNIAAEAKARAAGSTGYLREGILGAHYYEAFVAPPSRRVRARRALSEARRRLSEAVLVVRTGSTSYEDDL